MLKKYAPIVSGVLLGYSTAHVVIFYFIFHILLNGIGIDFDLSSGLNVSQALNSMILGAIFYFAFDVDFKRKEDKFMTWFGVGLFVFLIGVILH